MSDRKLRMRVEGMTCTGCEMHVARALESVGAQDVRADFQRGAALFTVPAGTDTEPLNRAVEAAGYRPGTIEALEPGRAAGSAVRSDGDSYDLAIVGSGAAAFAAAIRARDLGARVVMVERGTLGGTCVNVGCVPSKTLLRAAENYHRAGHHPFVGLETFSGRADLAALVGQKNDLVAALRQEKYADLVEAYGWEVVQGEASFLDPGTLQVNGRTIRAKAFLVATGASPAVPPVPGLVEAGYLTSTTAMELARVPESLLVIGSGYVALEQGQLFRHLGARVTTMQRGPRILREYEPEVAEAVAGILQGEDIAVVTGARVRRVEGGPGGRRVYAEVQGRERVFKVEEILVAAGRQPSTAALGLDRAGVQTDERGAVMVDEGLRTANTRVWAAGDVTGGPQFVYVAAYEGALAAENALTGAGRKVDLRAVPAVVFTNPQIATVGLTEAAARVAGYEVKASVLPLKAVPRALVNHEIRGVFKLVAEAGSERVLGAHVVAENAGEAIYAATLAVKFKLTVRDLVETFAPYLTMAEGLKLAAQTFGRDVARLSCCAS